MAAMHYKMAAVHLFLLSVIVVNAHVDDMSLSGSSQENGLQLKRTPGRRASGLFIDLPDVPEQLPEDNSFHNPDETTSTTLTTPPGPPMNVRYRRIFRPDETASVQEYPFIAAVLMNRQLWCGAAIIDQDKVLTAAHCLQLQYNNRFFREYVKMITVRVGSTNATAGGELLRVTELFFHPNYKPETLEFNVVVLKLHKNMSLGKKESPVQKVEYSRDNIIPIDKEVTFLGWGSVLSTGGLGGDVLLQKITLPVYDTADCMEKYGRDLVTRNNFCAGYITRPKNVCNHDAGGPAVMNGLLVGTLSFSSRRCDALDQPAVFTSVGAMAAWLDDIMISNGDK